MALCTRCGQRTEAGAEFCAACGGGPDPDAYASVGSRQASDYAGDGGYQADGYRPAAERFDPPAADQSAGGYQIAAGDGYQIPAGDGYERAAGNDYPGDDWAGPEAA